MARNDYNEKRAVIVAARELGYSTETVERIKESKDIMEIRRIMVTARNAQ